LDTPINVGVHGVLWRISDENHCSYCDNCVRMTKIEINRQTLAKGGERWDIFFLVRVVAAEVMHEPG